MAKKTTKQLHEALRQKYLEVITDLLGKDEEVMRVKSNEIAFPTLDEDGNDEWIVVTVKVPTGSRDDGEAYDGYGMAEQYKEAVAEKEAKQKEAEIKKAKKIARDKADREARAKAKAEHEAKKGEG